MSLTRLRSVVGECRRNVSTSPFRSITYGAVLAALIAAAALLDTLTIATLIRQADAFRAAGGSTQVLYSPGAVDREGCEGLPTSAGFSASGSLQQVNSAAMVGPGSSSFPAYEISPGLARRLGIVDSGNSGVYLATTFAIELGADRGTILMTADGPLTVLGTFVPGPQDSGSSRLSSALVSIVPAVGAATECWAETWPVDNRDPLLLTALSPDASSKETSIDPLNAVVGQQFAGAEAFGARTTRFATTAAAVGAFLLGVVYARARRLELASSLHAGADRIFATATVVAETAVIGIPALALAALVYEVVLHLASVDLDLLLPALALAATIASGLFATGAATAASLVRESDLFTLFKAR